MRLHKHAALAVLALAVLGFHAAASADPWDALETRAAQAHGEAGLRAAKFLREHRPESDADLDADMLFANLDLALRARAELPWAADVPEEMFHNDVLPYAVFDETRENWRPAMYDRCRLIVSEAKTAEDAIQALNRDLFNQINVHYNTGRKAPNQSPAESIAQGRATCTGLAIILVDACRSVGIPARAAGVANWHNKRGNHTWVEAWDGQRWRFTGADEYNKNGLDRGWFKRDASKAIPGDPVFAVWATSWRDTGSPFPMVWAEGDTSVHAVDATHHYLNDETPAAQPASATDANAEITAYLRAWDGQTRLAAEIRVIDASGAESALLTTNAGTTDLNDMPAVALRPGSTYCFDLTHGGAIYTTTHTTPDKSGSETIDLRIESMDRVLSRAEAESAVDDAWRAHTAAYRPAEGQSVFWNEKELKYKVRRFGDAPAGDRSLWISMHGGGGAPAEVNDKQWENQIKLYEPAEGFYVAPRAPTDTWNLWHRRHIDHLFDALIERFVIEEGVDPNRVYLMGYSAGGDGVFQLAPRTADRFAAAAMMAGHPNETTPEGLRNLPFAIFMGGKDESYNRNTVARQWGDTLAALAERDPDGYPHLVRIYPEHGHWMNGDDKEALPWMAGHTRNPWPTKVVWKQDDVTHGRFYWLGVPESAAKPRTLIAASAAGQTIDITLNESAAEPVRAVRFYLRDELLDLDEPVLVRVNGEAIYTGRAHRTRAAVDHSLEGRPDPVLAATAILDLAW